MAFCCAVGCHNRRTMGRNNHSLYRFPKEPQVRQLWINKVNRANWTPTHLSSLCDAHFVRSDYQIDPELLKSIGWESRTLRLKKTAVPSVFPHLTEKSANMRSVKKLNPEGVTSMESTVVTDVRSNNMLEDTACEKFGQTFEDTEESDDDSSSDSSSGEDADINELLDQAFASDRVKSLVDDIKHELKECEEKLNVIEPGFSSLEEFNKKVDSCLDKMRDTLGKWVFPRISIDNPIKEDVCVVDLPSGIVPKPKPFGNVATKKVTHRFHNASRVQNFTKKGSSFDPHGEVIPVKKVAPLTNQRQLPPPGSTVIKPPLSPYTRVFCMITTFKGVWYPGQILSVIDQGSENGNKYRVKVDKKNKKSIIRYMSGKCLAYQLRPNVILPVGTRIIAQYKEEPCLPGQPKDYKRMDQLLQLYAGIIAEPPKNMNSDRYLIFFDDGYAQYSPINEVFLVCECSKSVWDDIHPDSSWFIKHYLQQYPERPMVKLQRNQSIKTEWNGKWWITKVLAVDGSLVKVFFEADQRTEWIYRGSMRLSPLYEKMLQQKSSCTFNRVKRRLTAGSNFQHLPYIEYTYSLDDKHSEDNSEENLDASSNSSNQSSISRNVAKKSSAKPATLGSSRKSEDVYTGGVSGTIEKVRVHVRENYSYGEHGACNQVCVTESNDIPDRLKGKNPLEIPVHCGWRREIVRGRPGKKKLVFYKAPCGRRLRNIEEVNSYLVMTSSKLTIDFFCFDSFIQLFKTFVPGRILMQIIDVSYGRENVPIPCVNQLGADKPANLEYSTKRIPGKDVNLNTNPDFLSCCDCNDNCFDKLKCSCQQLTIEASALMNGDRDHSVGYNFRRLENQVFTGLYECNDRCNCNKQCMNRVVQNGLQQRLQLFKTQKKGWGLRTLDDIAKGSFLCIYAGQILNEHEANKEGKEFGDEYMAELDYIEVIENQPKEGYETDVCESDAETAKSEQDNGSDSDNSYHDGNSSDHNSSDSDNQLDHTDRTTRKQRKVTDTKADGSTESDSSSKNVWETTLNQDALINRTSPKTDSNELPDIEVIEEKYDRKAPLSPTTLKKVCSYKLIRKPRLSKTATSSEVSDTDDELTSKLDLKTEKDVDEMKSSKTTADQQRSRTSSNSSSSGPVDVENEIVEDKIVIENKMVKPESIRKYFGDDCYVMDAKSTGNIGRYLNHSCSPNVFVQNVFVDSHDVRFPWVAFFAGQMIKAGDELTWDYNYEVGSVRGREIYCQCKSSNCRGRLL